MTLIGATTENPYFEVNSALLSRAQIYELRAARARGHRELLRSRALRTPSAGSPTRRGRGRGAGAAGQALRRRRARRARRARAGGRDRPRRRPAVDLATAEDALQRKALTYDREGDRHYDYISAWIKATRGSDPDASLYYLAVMLEGGEDPRFIARRMVILASEDIGNADPQALVVATAAAQAVDRVGLPECQLNLAQAAAYLALAPKSNASYRGDLGAPSAHVREHGAKPPPTYLRDAHYPGAQEARPRRRATSTRTTSRAASPTSRCSRRARGRALLRADGSRLRGGARRSGWSRLAGAARRRPRSGSHVRPDLVEAPRVDRGESRRARGREVELPLELAAGRDVVDPGDALAGVERPASTRLVAARRDGGGAKQGTPCSGPPPCAPGWRRDPGEDRRRDALAARSHAGRGRRSRSQRSVAAFGITRWGAGQPAPKSSVNSVCRAAISRRLYSGWAPLSSLIRKRVPATTASAPASRRERALRRGGDAARRQHRRVAAGRRGAARGARRARGAAHMTSGLPPCAMTASAPAACAASPSSTDPHWWIHTPGTRRSGPPQNVTTASAVRAASQSSRRANGSNRFDRDGPRVRRLAAARSASRRAAPAMPIVPVRRPPTRRRPARVRRVPAIPACTTGSSIPRRSRRLATRAVWRLLDRAANRIGGRWGSWSPSTRPPAS